MSGAIEAQEYWGPGENQIPSRSQEHQVTSMSSTVVQELALENPIYK